MAEEGIADGEHGGHPASFEVEAVMAHGVDAPMHTVQPA